MKTTQQLSAVLFLAGALAVTAGCNAPRQPTITQGVFGELISGCDTLGCTDRPIGATTVELYTSDPRPTDGGAAPTAVLSTVSESDGFYELSADAGSYFISIGPNVSYGKIDVSSGQKVQWNFTAGPGGGRWTKVN